MNGFSYRGGNLFAEDIPVADLVGGVGTPFYCYSAAALRQLLVCVGLGGLDAEICYAVKANSNQAVIELFASMGAGADVVSGGELRRALAAGVSSGKIVFSGVGKSRPELTMALELGCGQFNVESEPELDLLSDIASGMGKTATIVFRVNPDVDADTHDKISTGRAGDKFGIEFERIGDVYAHAGLSMGSMCGVSRFILAATDHRPIPCCIRKNSQPGFRAQADVIDRLDLGGGLGIVYRNEHCRPRRII